MLSQRSFKKIEKWTSSGAMLAVSLLFLGVAGGGIYFTIHYLLFVEDGISLETEKSELTSSIKGNKYLDLSGAVEEREKKISEIISPFDNGSNSNQNKKDPFNLP